MMIGCSSQDFNNLTDADGILGLLLNFGDQPLGTKIWKYVLFLHHFLTCYMSRILSTIEQNPSGAIEFEGGARFVPHEETQFYKDEDRISCLAIQAIDQSDGSIIGSNMRTGYFWEYDLLNQRVGFVPLSKQL